MSMKLFSFVSLLFLADYAFGCVTPNIIEDGTVTIMLDKDTSSGIYHVRVPEEYKGAPIKSLILSAHSGDNEISLPLSIKSNSKATGSFFYMSSQWLNVRVTASYKGIDGTELIATLDL